MLQDKALDAPNVPIGPILLDNELTPTSQQLLGIPAQIHARDVDMVTIGPQPRHHDNCR
jgi:hypothetical protein